MTVTINVNDLSLCHQDSGGIAMATLPDVCKTPTPGGPVPLPYPNIARSQDLKKGTKDVTADGGHSIAVKGSEFSRSTGDEPGTVGGVKSSTQLKEATWLLYSFDVKMEGKNACRLTDKMLMNHGNTVCLGGLLQPSLIVKASRLGVLAEVQRICDAKCDCQATGQGQTCITKRLQLEDDLMGNTSTIKAEPPYDMSTHPPRPIMSKNNPKRTTRSKPKGSRIPDAVVVSDGTAPPTQDKIKAVIEVKLGPDDWRPGQQEAYEIIAGRTDKLVMVDESNCKCPEPKKEPVPDPVPVVVPEPRRREFPVKEVVVGVAAVALIALAVATAPATATALAAVALFGLFSTSGTGGSSGGSAPASL